MKRGGAALLADDQGLGKTPQALVFLRKIKNGFPALVVCPAATTINWERECRVWCTDSVRVAEKPGDLSSHHDVVIISYDSLSREMETLMARKFRTLIMDEVQNIASRTSLRYANLKKLALRERRSHTGRKGETTLHPRIPYRLAISGTPIPNRPIDGWTTLSILWPHTFGSFWDYAQTFSYPYRPRGRPYWIFQGSRNPGLLRKLLKKHGMVRRLKKDHKEEIGLTDKQRSIRPVRLRSYKEYDEADANFIKWLSKVDVKRAKRAARMEAFTKITYLLRLAAKYKARHVTRYIDWHLQSGEKLVVFSFIKPLLKALERRYGDQCVRIDGDTRGRERMALVDRFQTDKRCLLALCNGKAAGVGLTLHAAHWCLIADFPWNPSLLWQMEDRIHRFGQKVQTKYIYMLARRTLEEHVFGTLMSKQKIIERIMNRKNSRSESKDLDRLSESMQATLLNKIKKGSNK